MMCAAGSVMRIPACTQTSYSSSNAAAFSACRHNCHSLPARLCFAPPPVRPQYLMTPVHVAAHHDFYSREETELVVMLLQAGARLDLTTGPVRNVKGLVQ